LDCSSTEKMRQNILTESSKAGYEQV